MVFGWSKWIQRIGKHVIKIILGFPVISQICRVQCQPWPCSIFWVFCYSVNSRRPHSHAHQWIGVFSYLAVSFVYWTYHKSPYWIDAKIDAWALSSYDWMSRRTWPLLMHKQGAKRTKSDLLWGFSCGPLRSILSGRCTKGQNGPVLSLETKS